MRLVLAAVLLLGHGRLGRADDLTGFAELAAGRNETSSTTLGNPEVATGVRYRTMRFGLDWRRQLFPRLLLRLGGTFDRQDTFIDETGSDTFRKRTLPYARLTTSTPTFFAELAYDRNVERSGGNGFSSEFTREASRVSTGWTMPGVKTRLEWLRSDAYDAGRRSLDARSDRTDFSLAWDPGHQTNLEYRAGLAEEEDRLRGSSNRTFSQSARAGYAHQTPSGRTAFVGEYIVGQTVAEAFAADGAELVVPVLALEALFSADDTPQAGTLPANAELADRDRLTSAGINLGLPGPGGDTRLRNLGLDFGTAASVNRISVWIDRVLPPEIAVSFSWRLYSSVDNIDWTFLGSLGSTTLDTFEPRFDLNFGDLQVRYLKVVVAPLSPTAPDASNWPSIFVTEIEARRRSRVEGNETRVSSVSHQLNTSLRVGILSVPAMAYEFSGFASDATGSPATASLTNALSIGHVINPVYSVFGRVSRDDRIETFADSTVYNVSSSLYATPLPTLTHALSLSGRHESAPDSRNDLSVGLSSNAQIYRGVDGSLFVRRSGTRNDIDGSSLTSDFGVSFSVNPHPALAFGYVWQRGTTEFRGTSAFRPDITRGAQEVSANWRPVPLLYLSAARRWEDPEAGPDLTLSSYGVTWTPFPQGNLRFLMSYNESYRSELQTLDRFLITALRWNVTSRMFIDLSYQKTTSEDRLLATNIELQTINVSARISF